MWSAQHDQWRIFIVFFGVKSFSFNEKEERVKDDKDERPDA